MKYFDKDFFKFTLGFLAIIALSLLIMYAVSVYAAGVDRIVFTTEAQSIKTNTLSEPITIQTQDSSGNSYKTPETIDLVFTSSSATGEFISSTGNPVAEYMSKNTANRTFYYRDSTSGNFVITVYAIGRDSGQEWNASQNITISSGAPGEVLSVSSESTSSSSESNFSGETTTNVSSLNSRLEVVAGKDRVTSPGSPIWFQAEVKKNTTGSSPVLNWSFGDGYVGVGSLVSHSYKYPGDYVVVLTSRTGDIFSVSRLNVKVVDSNISVSETDGYLEISNRSNAEINLFNWRIENKGKAFIFQPNTIVLPRSSMKLDKNLLNIKDYGNSLGIILKNPIGAVVFSSDPVQEVDTGEISEKLESIRNESLIIKDKIRNLTSVYQSNNLSPEPEIIADSDISTTAPNIIYEAPKSEGFISKLTNFFKRVFSR